MQDIYWEKELKVLYGCLGVSCLSLYIAAHCLNKSIETASISIYNHYDDAITIKEILNDYEGCKF